MMNFEDVVCDRREEILEDYQSEERLSEYNCEGIGKRDCRNCPELSQCNYPGGFEEFLVGFCEECGETCLDIEDCPISAEETH